ncbi:MAG: XRE family transcriptional regulator [marine bacterium B5-7]|nr:MAG: XRE family transcriptional regulator [marine bacterium B5-7]
MIAETIHTPATIDRAIGQALRGLREDRGLNARQLAQAAAVSTAMISRIENGQVSPSIATLNALSVALEVPLISLFRETATHRADFTHVKQGEGLKSTRIADSHSHEFTHLAYHKRRELKFDAHSVTLKPQDAKPPVYIGHGVVFIYAIEGEAEYLYGKRSIHLSAGDSLSFDAEVVHGFSRILTNPFRFLSIQAEAQR